MSNAEMVTTSTYTLDRERQCRARGHVFIRDFRHSDGQFEVQGSDNCFRCTMSKAEAAEQELAEEPEALR